MPVNNKSMQDLEKPQEGVPGEQPKAPVNDQARATLNHLMSDPDVVQLLRAKQAGQKVKVVSGDDPPPIPEPEEDFTKIPIDELDNRQLIDLMDRRVASSVKKILSEHLAPVTEKLAQTQDFMKHQRTQQVQSEIDRIRAKYKDFDDFRDEMVKVSQSHPTLGVEQVYFLAKTEKGSPITPNAALASERPTGETVKPSLRERRGKDLPIGTKGRNQLIDEVLAGIDLDLSKVD